MSISKDIKEITLYLEEIENRRKLALDVSGVGIWEWDLISGKLTWDNMMFEIYGTNPQDFNGIFEDWKSKVHPDDFPAAQEALFQCLHDTTGLVKYTYRFRIKNSKNEWRWVLGIGGAVRDDNGIALKIIGINMLEHFITGSTIPCSLALICPKTKDDKDIQIRKNMKPRRNKTNGASQGRKN